MAWTHIRKRETKKGTVYQASVKEVVEGKDKTIWSGTFKTKG